MATMPTTDPPMHNSDDTFIFSKSNRWPVNATLQTENPVSTATTIENNGLEISAEQVSKSVTPSPLGTPKNSDGLRRSSPHGSNNVYSSHFNTARKVILNVGGIRHESN